ncbi:hypothetical protein HY844_01155 [Candidatus Berkelbacteria bacterium]|nr:hypothetical protein [Candidatus Berkelbacteria bacterium]
MYLFYIGLGIVVFGAILHFTGQKNKSDINLICVEKLLKNFRTLRVTGNELRLSQIQAIFLNANTEVGDFLTQLMRSYTPKHRVVSKAEVINQTRTRLIGKELYVKEASNEKEVAVVTYADLPEEIELPSETELLITTAEKKGMICLIYLERMIRKNHTNFQVVGVQIIEPHGEIKINLKQPFVLYSKLSHLFVRALIKHLNIDGSVFKLNANIAQNSIETMLQKPVHMAEVGSEELARVVSHLKHSFNIRVV